MASTSTPIGPRFALVLEGQIYTWCPIEGVRFRGQAPSTSTSSPPAKPKPKPRRSWW